MGRLRAPRLHVGRAGLRARAAGTLVLLALLLTASFAAGRSYFWCVPMQQVVTSCCCPGGDDEPTSVDRDEAPRLKSGCCDARIAPDLPVTAQAEAGPAELPPASFVAVVLHAPETPSPVLSTTAPPAPPVEARFGPIRAGPSSASDTCIRLQSFRC